MKKTTILCLLLTGLLFCVGITGCGKEKDPQTTEVIKISPTPEGTPTPTPKVINSSSVTTNGGLTMINEYRVSEDTEGES